MNNYFVGIIQALINHQGKISYEELQEDLGISVKMINYYVDQLNFLLNENGIGKIQKKVRTVEINEEEIDLLIKFVETSEYYFNSAERAQLIIIMIGLVKKLNLTDLMSITKTTKNTVLTDIEKIKKELIKDYIYLKYNKKNGYYFEGNELLIRYHILFSVHKNNNKIIETIKKKKILEQFNKYMNDENILSKVIDIVLKTEDERHTYFSIQDLAISIIVSYVRSKIKKVEVIDIELNKNELKTISKLEKDGFDFNKQEKQYISLLFKSAKIGSFTVNTRKEIIDCAKELIEEFERVYGVRVKDNPIYQMFLSHIESMYYRTKYHIKVSSIIDQTRAVSGYYITNRILNDVGEKYGLRFDEYEIELMNYYFECLKRESEESVSKNNIIVVCASGFGSSAYVKYQIDELFNNEFQIKVENIRGLKKSVNDQTQLIVNVAGNSAIGEIKKYGIEYITVSVVLSDTDKKKLLNWLLKNPSSKNIETLHGIISIVGTVSDIKNKELLYKQLYKYLNEKEKVEYCLNDLISYEYINKVKQCDDLKEAIKNASKPLIIDGIIDAKYCEDMINTINKYGPYCEVVEGILVPHAIPEGNVVRPMFSILLIEDGLFVKQWQKTIKAIFVLAVTDKSSHINPFSQLIAFLQMNDNYLKINEQSKEELFETLLNFDCD